MAVIGNAYIAVHAIVDRFKKDVDNELSSTVQNFQRAGQQSGSSFSRGLSKGDALQKFRQEALAANEAFAKLVTTGYFVGPAISVAISGISALVSGLSALVMQVGAAVPALIVLPGIFAAIGQAALTAKLAFSGVGAAIKGLMKQKTGGGGGGGADQARQIEDAEKNLARVLESNREALARASKNLADAEDRLTEARKTAAESLQQLNFDAEDAAISEKKASIELEKARERLARVQDLPPNSRARREAELAYAEADLNLRRAKDRNSDLAKETEKANKAGVEGSREVVNATEAVQEATDAKARAERDALRAEEDALKRLEDAKKKAAGAGGGGVDPLAGLSEEAKAFVRYIVSIQDKIKELKAAAGKDLFPLLTVAIKNLVDNLFPRLIPILRETGKALGEAAVNISNVVTESSNLDELGKIGDTNTYVIRRMGDAAGNLYDVFLSLLTAADPLIRRFSDWVVTLTDGWRETFEFKNSTGELTSMFNQAGDVAAQLGSIFRNLYEAIKNIGKAASGPGSGGQLLLDAFEASTQKFEEFTKKLGDSGRLQQFFIDTAKNTHEISKLVVSLVKEFLKLGDNPGIGKTAQGLSAMMPTLGTIIDTLTSGSPYLTKFADEFLKFIKNFTETASLQYFFGTLTAGLKIINAVFGNEVVQRVLLFSAGIMGVVKALRLMNNATTFVFNAFSGYFFKAIDIVTTLRDKIAAARLVFANFGIGGGALAGIVAGVAAFIAVIVLAYKNSENFRKAIKDLIDVVWGNLKKAFESIKQTINEVLKSFGGTETVVKNVKNVFKSIGDFIAKYIVPIFKVAFVGAIDIVSRAIKVLINTVGAIAKVFQSVWKVVQGIFALLRGDVSGAVKHFGKAFSSLKDALKFVFNGIKDMLGSFGMSIIQGLWKGLVAGAKWIYDFFTGIGEWIINAVKSIFGISSPSTVFLDFGKNIILGFLNGLVSVMGDIASFFLSIPSKILGWLGILDSSLIEKGRELLSNFWNGIKNIFDTVWNAISSAISFAWNSVIRPVFESILTVFKTVWTAISAVFGPIWDLITFQIRFAWEYVIKPAFNAMLAIFGFVWEGIRRAFNLVWTMISSSISFVWDNVIKPIWNAIYAVFTASWEDIASVFTAIWDGISSSISFVWNNVIKPIWNAMSEIFSLAWSGIKAYFTTIWDIITGAISFYWNNVIQPIWDAMSTVFGVAWEGIKAYFTTVWNIISTSVSFVWNNVIKPIWDAMSTAFGVAWTGIKTAFDTVWGAISTAIDFAWNNVIKPVWDALSSTFESTWNTISSTFHSVWDPIYNAIIAFGEAVKSVFDGIAYFFNNAWDGFGSAATGAIKIVKTGLDKFWKAIKPIWEGISVGFSAAWSVIKTVFNVAWTTISTAISFVWNNVIKPIWSAMSTVFSFAWSGIKAYFTTVWNIITGAISFYWNNVIKPIWDAMSTVFGLAWSGIKTYFETVWNIISTSVSFVWNNVIKPIWDAMSTVFGLAWEGIKTYFTTVWNIITGAISFYWNNVIKPIWDAMSTVFGVAWEGIKLYFETVWNIISTAISFVWENVIKPVWDGMSTVFSTAWEGIRTIFATVWDAISTAINFVWNNVIKPAWTGIKTAFETAWNGIKTVFDTVWGGIRTAISNVYSWVSGVFTNVKTFVSNVIDGIVGFFTNLPGRISYVFGEGFKWLKDKITQAKDWVAEKINNIVEFVQNIPTRIGRFASGLFDGIKNAAKGAFNGVASLWNNTVGRLSFTVPSWVPFIGGSRFDVPDIPLLAKGAIVDKPTLAMIGEAGKEAVIPLTRPARAMELMQQSGLADLVMATQNLASVTSINAFKRPIAALQSAQQQQQQQTQPIIVNMTINASKGMDEVELAAIVSRQLAFELRRGAA